MLHKLFKNLWYDDRFSRKYVVKLRSLLSYTLGRNLYFLFQSMSIFYNELDRFFN